VNPELERRLRRFGATVDAAASAEQAQRARAGSDTHATGAAMAELDNVVTRERRRHRPYRALAVAAAAIAVAAAGITVAVGRLDPSTNIAEHPSTQASMAPGGTGPATTRLPVEVPATTIAPTTTTAGQPTAVAQPPPTSRPPVCPSYTPHNDYHLEICDSGAAVRLVQERLRASVDSSLTVDGYFGPATRNAVRTFQQLHGLSVDGQVGPATWALLVPDAPGTDADASGIVDPAEISTS
jgi:murein L,D-transpeptidase YcbB/YkuD